VKSPIYSALKPNRSMMKKLRWAKVGYDEFLHDYYAEYAASLIIIKSDPIEYTAVGFTHLVEAMAMGRPVIVTRTSALPTEIDVKKAGCGLHVPPEDPVALARVIQNSGRRSRTGKGHGRGGAAFARDTLRYSELHRRSS
jgi:glycosyltransferase involved in cell wall biosynthesis